MPRYTVTIPCTMAVVVSVEADDEEGAKEAAFNVDFNVELKGDPDASPEIIEFETHEQITKGNVYYGCINEMEVIEY